MKKFLFAVLMFVSAAAFAAESTVAVTSVKNRVDSTYGSKVRVDVQEDAFGVGLESQKVGVAMRNQGDIYWTPVNIYGVSAGVGLGTVTQTGVTTHGVYLAKAGYTHDFGALKAIAGVAYRNDFDDVIADRRSTLTLGGAYSFDAKTSVGANYARSYGDSKTDNFAITANRKF